MFYPLKDYLGYAFGVFLLFSYIPVSVAEETGKINLNSLAISAIARHEYSKAIDLWLKLLSLEQNKLNELEIAEIANGIASSYFQIGKYSQAINYWNKSLEIYQKKKINLAEVEVELARAYLALGKTSLAKNSVISVIESKEYLPQAKSRAYATLATLNILSNNEDEAEENYKKSLELAQTDGEKIVILNSLSKLFSQKPLKAGLEKKLEEEKKARLFAKKALDLSLGDRSFVRVEILLQWAKLIRDSPGNISQKSYISYLEEAQLILNGLNNSVQKALGLIELSQLNYQRKKNLHGSISVAEEIGENSFISLASGYLGQFYLEKGEYQKALAWTNKAREIPDYFQREEDLYKWHWQAGKIYGVLGKNEEAIQGYKQAIFYLQKIRKLGIEAAKQLDFESEVEPVYRELLHILLKNNPSDEQIRNALQIRDLLQLSELEDYFGDSCFEQIPGNLLAVNNLATVHTIILEEETYLILQVEGKIKNIKIDISDDELEKLIKEWRWALETRYEENYFDSGKILYELLINPIKDDLAEFKIEKIIFINDGLLRTIPMAALHNGENFLIQDYALGFSLGLNLKINEKDLATEKKMVAFGLSEATELFYGLPSVETEINLLEEFIDVKTILNEDFVFSTIEKQLTKQNIPLVHIATHGQFNGTIEESFLMTHQGKMNLLDWKRLLEENQANFAESIELLTLSACETAAGNKRSILGLAGIGIRSGINNVLGSLWSIDDRQIVFLMEDFYRYFLNDGLSPIQALQKVQINLIFEGLSHPAIWSSFILVR